MGIKYGIFVALRVEVFVLLGYSGLKHTEKYTRAVDKLKEESINSLPELELGE